MTQYQIIAAICFAIAVHCYVIISLYWQNKLKIKYTGYQYGMWGRDSWWRKYDYKVMWSKDQNGKFVGMAFGVPAPKTWYYKTFEIKYQEKFPLSATALVWLTDGFHLVQFFMIKFFCAAVAFAVGGPWWMILAVFAGVRLIWYIVFNVWYKVLGVVIIGMMLTSCTSDCYDRPDNNVITSKYYSGFFDNEMPKGICRFFYGTGQCRQEFRDSCHFYHVLDTIK